MTTTTAFPNASKRYRTRADETLVVALAEGCTQRDAAQAARMSERTVRRRLDDPAFRQRITAARTERYQNAIAVTTHNADVAVATIVRIATEGQSESNRLRAAQLLLGLAKELVQPEELTDRIDALEDRVRRSLAAIDAELDDANRQ